nr:translation initiation factor IF-2-like [Aegilops tauschii subsp. strangulata]
MRSPAPDLPRAGSIWRPARVRVLRPAGSIRLRLPSSRLRATRPRPASSDFALVPVPTPGGRLRPPAGLPALPHAGFSATRRPASAAVQDTGCASRATGSARPGRARPPPTSRLHPRLLQSVSRLHPACRLVCRAGCDNPGTHVLTGSRPPARRLLCARLRPLPTTRLRVLRARSCPSPAPRPAPPGPAAPRALGRSAAPPRPSACRLAKAGSGPRTRTRPLAARVRSADRLRAVRPPPPSLVAGCSTAGRPATGCGRPGCSRSHILPAPAPARRSARPAPARRLQMTGSPPRLRPRPAPQSAPAAP